MTRNALALCTTLANLSLGMAALNAAETKVLWLDEMNLKHAVSGWGETQAKRTVDNRPLTLRGTVHERGIGTHPPGALRIDLDSRGVRFKAITGVDDEVGEQGSVEFQVMGDGKKLWSSGILKGKGEIKPCDIDIAGIKLLDLVVDTTPDGYAFDHSDWADARIEYQGAKAPETQPAPKPIRPANTEAQRWPPADQVFDKHSLPDPADRDEADAVLRRVGALLTHLKSLPRCPDLTQEAQRLAELQAQSGQIATGNPQREVLLAEACKLRRRVAFANPLLDFDKILFIKRQFCPNAETTGNHMCDQYFGFNAIRGGGLFVLEKPFSDHPTTRNVLEKSVCENSRYQGRALSANDGFLAPELSFDGKEVLFACTEIAEREGDRKRYSGTGYETNTYKIFRVKLDGSGLTQLTDGIWNDFDPCYLPSGRIMFISERRGGFGRCHGRPVPSFTLHSMNPDGSDIVALSPHETNEWQPSMANNGMIVYTRWDYVDRGFNQAHHAWTTTPDGRDPRAVHGNFSPNQGARPHFEISMRAIPGSHKYMGTAACHHGQAYGSIILVDPLMPDDNAMAPVKRLTPDQLFPEAEIGTHGPPANYAAPYPLSEWFFLCVYDQDSRSDAGTANNYGIYLVDAFGNKELLYRDDAISCLDPIPVRARPVPPVLPHLTAVGKPLRPGTTFVPPDPKTIPDFGTVGLINVYDSIYPMTELPRITALRVIQLLPKTTPFANNPRIGFGDQKSARMVLGTVPVEADGSAFFKLPVNRPVYFQALDAAGVAVQSMRSATYVHPGETLTCLGCHNSPTTGYRMGQNSATALRRQPSELEPDVEGSKPFSYKILVQPVLQKNCVECHTKGRAEGKRCPDLTQGETRNGGDFFTSYNSLREFTFFWDNAVFDNVPDSKPGQVGARRSKLYEMLTKGHHNLQLSREDLHRLTLWMDCNSDFYGSYEKLEEQKDGKVVWPSLE
ncbi:MAG: NPCBM/NEW2 domain-containing protein [Verrucomicrobia bacterium]|nr:NPCBM/NEW2 domain-containing protein [Verrucomicrobiota bacterium]